MYKTPYNATYADLTRIRYPIHPWLKAVTQGPDARWLPNKDRPKLLDYNNKRFKQVGPDDDPFQRGDIIWISFTINYFMKRESWLHDVVPLDLVRVARSSSGPEQKKSNHSNVDLVDFPFLDEDVTMIVQTDTSIGKRKREGDDEEGSSKVVDVVGNTVEEVKPFKSDVHHNKAPARLRNLDFAEKIGYIRGIVKEIIHDAGRGAPSPETFMATEGTFIGTFIYCGKKATLVVRNVLPIGKCPEGTIVCKLEKKAGNRGALARTSKTVSGSARANVGIVAGGGRIDKPLLKSGGVPHIQGQAIQVNWD
ncbi:hypothetical protein EST38_g9721 [Candolleomyces aberdarensis]|uniref:Uncharacterized protein n=1 Tax=Candolleomyces aberdarensis TaxID=2316362 RepID=A0A4Q2DC44_9AGAR|nr:hypothetical protein EST38_g9721 [Candolleomyces aberdarensis]